MKKRLVLGLALALVLPAIAFAQVQSQNQLLPNTYYGSASLPAFLISNSSTASAKLAATTTPFFKNFSFGTATGTNVVIVGAAKNCNGTSALTTTSTGLVNCTAQPQGTVTGVNPPLTGPSSGIIGIQKSNTTDDGYLAASDWNIFNNKQATISTTWPIILSGTTISFGGLSTTTNLTQGQLPYVTGVHSFGQVATTSVTCTGSATCTSFTAIGASPVTINVTGSGGSSYPFPLTGNATSTLTQFNGGITAYSTSTIGDSTQANGLTISGGATTTGTAYFANNVGFGIQAPGQALDIIGKIRQANTTTDATNKSFFFLDRNFTNAQNDFLLMFGQSKTNGNTLIIGGGQTGFTAASTISLFAGTGNNTDTGTAELTATTGGVTISTLSSGLVGSNASGLLYSFASSSIFGYTPLNPTRTINTTFPLAGGGDLSADRTLTFNGLSTTTNLTQGQLPYVTGVNTFGQVATTSVNCTGNATCTSFTAIGASPVTINVAAGTAASSTLLGDTNTFSGTDKFSNPITDGTLSGLIGGNNGLTYAISTTSLNASITGNAGTATSFAANGTNCSAGNAPLGIDASGNVEGCFAVDTFAYPFPAGATTTLVTFTNATTTLLTATTAWITNLGKALNGGAFQINNIADPTSAQDAATKAYVDNAVSGTDFKDAVKYASTGALPALVYSNGSSGVGATLTEVGLGALALDSQTPSVGDRVLIKNQVSTFQNGIYAVTTVGSAGAVFVMTRTTDFDQSTDIDIGDSVFVTSGSTLANTTWVQNGTNGPVMGTDPITFSQIAGPGSILAGTGISVSGLTISNTGVISNSCSSGVTCSGTNPSAITLSTIAANTFLANNTSATAVPTAISTSTIFGTVQAGKILAGFSNGTVQYVATSTDSCGTGVTCSYAGGVNTFSIANSAITDAMLASTFVKTLTIASANGFAGSSSGGSTPAITITTTITGLLKGNGTSISAATAGSDYVNGSGMSGNCVQWGASNSLGDAGSPCGSGGGGSGTVNAGIFGQTAFYGANGTAVSGTSTLVIGTTTQDANHVGIGTTSPTATLTVASVASADATPAFVVDGATGSFNADMVLNRGSNTGTEEANIDFNTAGVNNWQLGIQNNSTSDFELWDGSNDPIFTVKSGTQTVGFGTTTPFGDFAINADYGDVLPGNLIFNVASSSLTGTTSLFTISNTGVITTRLGNALILSGGAGTALSAYGGAAACTNQVVTAISATGGTTCATVADAMLASTFVKTLTVTTAAGVSGSFTAGATPVLSLTLGALTGVTSLNGLVVTANTGVITTGTWNGTTIAEANGGTGATSVGANMLVANNGSSVMVSTSTPSATAFLATSTVATSTFQGGFEVGTTTQATGGTVSAMVTISNATKAIGGLLINTWTNVVNALSIVNAAGTTVFNVDTTATSAFWGVGTTTPEFTSDVLDVANTTQAATTTISLGSIGVSGSKVQFNIKNSAGSDDCMFVNSANALTVITGKCNP